MSPFVVHVICDVYIGKYLCLVSVLSSGTNMFQEAFLHIDEGTDGVSSICDDLLAGMLPFRGIVVPAMLSAWGNHVTSPEQHECDVDICKILYAVCRVVCGTTMFQEALTEDLIARAPDGSRGEALKVCSPFALGLRPLWSWYCRGCAPVPCCPAARTWFQEVLRYDMICCVLLR